MGSAPPSLIGSRRIELFSPGVSRRSLSHGLLRNSNRGLPLLKVVFQLGSFKNNEDGLGNLGTVVRTRFTLSYIGRYSYFHRVTSMWTQRDNNGIRRYNTPIKICYCSPIDRKRFKRASAIEPACKRWLARTRRPWLYLSVSSSIDLLRPEHPKNARLLTHKPSTKKVIDKTHV